MSLSGLLCDEDSPLSENEEGSFRSNVSILLYIAEIFRPHTTVTASTLRSFFAGPAQLDMKAAKRLLCYLRSMKDYVFMTKPRNERQIMAFPVANWCGKAGFNIKSRSRIVVYYRNASIYISRSTEKVVSLSYSEAEYIPLSEACKSFAWLRQVRKESREPQKSSGILQDGKSTIRWARERSLCHFLRRKHIDIRHHFIMSMFE